MALLQLEERKMEVAHILAQAMRSINEYSKVTPAAVFNFIEEKYPNATLKEIDTIHKSLLEAIVEEVEVDSDTSVEVMQPKRKGRKRKRSVSRPNKNLKWKPTPAKLLRRRTLYAYSGEDSDDD